MHLFFKSKNARTKEWPYVPYGFVLGRILILCSFLRSLPHIKPNNFTIFLKVINGDIL